MTRRYNPKNIRYLLMAGFSDENLRQFCFDEVDFRPVYDQLAQNSGKAEIIDRLIEYAERKLLFDRLLAWAKAEN